MGRVESRLVWNYGLAAPHRARNLLTGATTGFIGLSALMGLLVGTYRFDGVELQGVDIVRWGAYWAFLFTGVALSEECLVRSYAFFSLWHGIRFWPAAAWMPPTARERKGGRLAAAPREHGHQNRQCRECEHCPNSRRFTRN